MITELLNSSIKAREAQIRRSVEKKKGTRGRKRSKKTIRVQELILDTLFVSCRLMRSSEIRIAVGKRVKGLSNYLFFSALRDLQNRGDIVKRKNLLNMKYTFYALSEKERHKREAFSYPAPDQYSALPFKYLSTIPYSLEGEILVPRFFW
ncbi:MAG: hypothetical protein GF308_11155 [Candidatus Heimdallarchaeota archaeon]|nr:hypothetical protein [Candidatus Heimdallarchaeota archaeon]